MRPCERCGRSVKANEGWCPFCGAPATVAGAVPVMTSPASAPRTGSRSAMLWAAVGVTLAMVIGAGFLFFPRTTPGAAVATTDGPRTSQVRPTNPTESTRSRPTTGARTTQSSPSQTTESQRVPVTETTPSTDGTTTTEPVPPAGPSACGTPHGPYEAPAKQGGSVTTAWHTALFSWNPYTDHGNAVANLNPRYLANTGFWYYDDKLQLVNNDSFGTCEKLSDNPLTVKYTISSAAKWQDGVPVTAADLLLQWASGSFQFDTEALKADDYGVPQPQAGIAFDSYNPAMALVTEFPVISEDGQSLTIKYSAPYADYAVQLNVGVPAHVVAMKAGLGGDASAATAALIKVLKDYHGKAKRVRKDGVDRVDPTSVAAEAPAVKKVVDFWNTGFDFTELPDDPARYLGNGPYKLTEYKRDQYLTFEKDPNFTAGPKPGLDKITVRIVADPMAVMQALKNQMIDIASPQVTPDVVAAATVLRSSGFEVINGDGATFEHIDLAVDNGGPFDPKTYGGDVEKARKVRLAFLKTIPRQDIVAKLIKPLNPNAQLRDSFSVAPGAPAYQETVAGNGSSGWAAVDIAGAKKLLAEAGVDKPTVRVMYALGNPRRTNEFQLIQASASQAGFTVADGADRDWAVHLNDTQRYDAAIFGWQSTVVGLSQISANYQTRGPNNFYGYSNPEVDRLLQQINAESDPKKQNQLNVALEKQLFTDGFGLPIFQFPEMVVVNSKKVQGVSMLSLNPGAFWNFWEWTTP